MSVAQSTHNEVKVKTSQRTSWSTNLRCHILSRKVSINRRINQKDDGWTFIYSEERSPDIFSAFIGSAIDISLQATVDEITVQVTILLTKFELRTSTIAELVKRVTAAVELMIELDQGLFGPRSYEQLLEEGPFSWLRPVPRSKKELIGRVVEHRPYNSTWAFRNFEVEVEDEMISWPGSLYDEKRKVWWGRHHDTIVVWEAAPPPDPKDLIGTKYR